jgi:hypothetical protein
LYIEKRFFSFKLIAVKKQQSKTMSVPDTFTGAPAQVADALVPVDQHLAHEARMGDRHVIAEAALGDHMLHRHPILERAAITHK